MRPRSITGPFILILIGVYFLYNFLRRPVSTGDPKELPLFGEQVAARIDSEAPASASKAEDRITGQPPTSAKEVTQPARDRQSENV